MENIIFTENDYSVNIGKPTGRLMFQFGDDSPDELAIINDHMPLTLTLQQNKKSEGGGIHGFAVNIPSIEFTSKCGKKFKLFIEDID